LKIAERIGCWLLFEFLGWLKPENQNYSNQQPEKKEEEEKK